MKQNGVNFPGHGILPSQFDEFFPKFFGLGFLLVRNRFDANHRFLVFLGPDTHQGTSKNLWMLIENGLAGDGKQIPLLGSDPVIFSAAVPDAALIIPPAKIPHSMPNAVTALNFGNHVRLGPMIIFTCDQVSFDHDFTNLAVGDHQIVGPVGNLAIRDSDDAQIDVCQRLPHAITVSLLTQGPGFGQDDPAADGGDRYGFGGPIGSMNFRLPGEHGGKLLDIGR